MARVVNEATKASQRLKGLRITSASDCTTDHPREYTITFVPVFTGAETIG